MEKKCWCCLKTEKGWHVKSSKIPGVISKPGEPQGMGKLGRMVPQPSYQLAALPKPNQLSK